MSLNRNLSLSESTFAAGVASLSSVNMQMQRVPLVEKYAVGWKSPFPPNAEGFTSQWWDMPVRSKNPNANEFYHWTMDGREVARALVKPGEKIFDRYEGIYAPFELVCNLQFFEVKGDLRIRGIGREAIRQLEIEFFDQTLIAFSEQADRFWRSVGWQLCPRVDHDPRYRPLFVRLPIRP